MRKLFLKLFVSLWLVLPVAVSGAGMKYSDYPNIPGGNMSNTYMFLVAAPYITNFNATWGQVFGIITNYVTNYVGSGGAGVTTNYVLTVALAGTNNVNGASNALWGFIQTVGANGTNYALGLGANATNYALALGLAGTNYTLTIGWYGTNYALTIGGYGTNYALAIGLNNTNYTLAIGLNNTNYTLGIGGNDTNFALSIGLAGTNNVNGLSNSLWTSITNTATNYLPLAGGTMYGAALSISASASNAPAQNEFPTAQWVRSLLASGILLYNSTNVDLTATNVAMGSPIYKYQDTIPAYQQSRTYTSMTNNMYIGGAVSTNTFVEISGPATVNTYLGISGGGTLTLKPELYYSYDKTNWYGDWDASGQSIGSGSNLYQWTISFPTTIATNAAGFYVARFFRVVSVGANPTLTVYVGSNTPSHISFSGPSSAQGNAFLAFNNVFTGFNTFAGMTNFGPWRISGGIAASNVLPTTNALGGTHANPRSSGSTVTNGGNIEIYPGVGKRQLGFGVLTSLTNSVITNTCNGQAFYQTCAVSFAMGIDAAATAVNSSTNWNALNPALFSTTVDATGTNVIFILTATTKAMVLGTSVTNGVTVLNSDNGVVYLGPTNEVCLTNGWVGIGKIPTIGTLDVNGDLSGTKVWVSQAVKAQYYTPRSLGADIIFQNYGGLQLGTFGTNGNFTAASNITSSAFIYLKAVLVTNIPAADTAGLYASTNATGLAELYAIDESGNSTILSPHSTEAPTNLMDGGWENITKEVNVFLGKVRFVNHTREAKITELTAKICRDSYASYQFLTGKTMAQWTNSNAFGRYTNALAALDAMGVAQVIVGETFAEYNARTGANLVQLDWGTVQTNQWNQYAGSYTNALDAYNAAVAAGDTNAVAPVWQPPAIKLAPKWMAP